MIKIFRRSGLLIPREYEDQFFYKQIKNFLTRRAKRYGYSDIIINEFFLETNKYLIIPRLFPINDFIECEIEDYSHSGEKINVNHDIELRNDLQKKVTNHLVNNDNTTLELEPGTGKTIMAIYDIVERGRKPLILVHTSDLTDQWRKEFLNHTDIDSNDILMVSSSNFYKMKDKKVLISTNQTFTSLLKRKREDFLKELDKANIGIFIGDEAHTSIGAATFSECSIHIPSKVTRALTATPYRYDGNGDIIEFHMGSIFSDESIEGTMEDVRVTMVLIDYGIDQPKRYKYLYWAGDFQRARYLNLMCKEKNCPRFHKALKSLIDKFKDNRDLIVVGERTKLIDNIYSKISSESKGKFYKSNNLSELTNSIVLTTPKKMRDGIDAPWKDCLILTSPISNIKQMTGRVCRINKNKEDTIVVDMVDFGCYPISKTAHTRINFYKKKNWPIKYLVIDLYGNVIEITESKAYELINLKKGS